MYDATVEVTTEVTMEETTEVINEQTVDTARTRHTKTHRRGCCTAARHFTKPCAFLPVSSHSQALGGNQCASA